MKDGNDTFKQAQASHDTVMRAREIREFNAEFPMVCYDATRLYLSLLCDEYKCTTRTALAENVLVLHGRGVDLGIKAFADACVIDAVFSYDEVTCPEMMHRLLAAYMSLRTAIFEYIVDNCETIYEDGKVKQPITGIELEANSFSYKFTLEQYYKL